MTSVHERHRQALEELEARSHVPRVVRAARMLGIEPEHPPVVLRSALRAGDGPYAESVLALGPRPDQVVAVGCWLSPPEAGGSAFPVRAGSLGWLTVTPITVDPVAATAARLEGDRSRLVRYHRGLRATVRVERPKDLRGCPVAFAKVFSDHRGAARHAVAARLAEASENGLLGFRVPTPARYDASRFVLWQLGVAGNPATVQLKGPDGPRLARAMGTAMASLHASGLDASHRITATTQLARAERHVAEAVRLVPGLHDGLMRLLDMVAGPDTNVRRPVAIHGSPDPSQWLMGPGLRPGLLDFDRFSVGTPEIDLACFLVEVEAILRHHGTDGATRAFLDGYRSRGAEVDAEELRRQATLRRIGKVVRAARALRVDGDDRATRVLAAAESAPAIAVDAVTRVGCS